jgi:hypothetical protein
LKPLLTFLLAATQLAVQSADVTQHGARNVASNEQIAIGFFTASITAGSNRATLPVAAPFVNGDYVDIPGAGPGCTLSTPAAPTVTPSNASAGTGTGLTVPNGLTGTTYSYVIIARDFAGCYTAASPTGTASGAPLGAQKFAISMLTRSGTTVSVVATASEGMATGGMLFISGTSSNAGFGGEFQVASVADNQHFTFTSGQDTATGGIPAATGGTAYYFNCNHLSWPPVPNAFLYYIYGRVNGSLVLLGVSRPQGATLDATWDDFGSPMMDNFTAPYWIPNVPPSSSFPDPLVTSISSGAGTTRLTLAAAATNSVANQPIYFDDGPAILAAVNANRYQPVKIPAGTYTINSATAFPPGTDILQQGMVYLNDTVSITGDTTWQGAPGAVGGTPQFGFAGHPGIMTGRATPGVWGNFANAATFKDLTFSSSQQNNALLVAIDQANPVTFSNTNFVTGTSSDYMGVGLLLRGVSTNTSYSISIDNTLFSAAQLPIGSTVTPAFYCNYCGQTQMSRINMNGRGIFYTGGTFTLNGGRSQGSITPILTQYTPFNGYGGHVSILNYEEDTTAQPLLTTLAAPGAVNQYSVFIQSSGQPSLGGGGLVSGQMIGYALGHGGLIVVFPEGPLGQTDFVTVINGSGVSQ